MLEEIGTLLKPHGLKGLVLIRIYPEWEEWALNYIKNRKVIIEKNNRSFEFYVKSITPFKKNYIVSLFPKKDRNFWELLRKSKVLCEIPEEERAKVNPLSLLIGRNVTILDDSSQTESGTLKDIILLPAGWYAIIKTQNREILIPFVEEWWDISTDTITVKPPKGWDEL